MGYIASSAALIPSTGFNYYVFFLHDYWNDELRHEFEDNFENLARGVGTDTVVIRGFDPEKFAEEVYRFYKPYIEHSYLLGSLPALLITDTPPSLLDYIPPKKRPKNRIILIPLESVYKKPGSITNILKYVAQTLKDGNAMESLKAANPFDIERKWGWLRYVDIRPNFYGFGVDLSRIVEERIFKS